MAVRAPPSACPLWIRPDHGRGYTLYSIGIAQNPTGSAQALVSFLHDVLVPKPQSGVCLDTA